MRPARSKVMRVSLKHWEAMARGEGRITNLPSDFRFVAINSIDSVDVGVIVHSQCYPSVPDGQVLPTFVAWFQKLAKVPMNSMSTSAQA